MTVSDKLAVVHRAHADAVTGLGAVGRDRKTLVARGHELDRAMESARRQRDKRGARGHRAFGAKGTAHKEAHDINLVRIDAEPLRDAGLEPVNKLAWLINGKVVTTPHAGR